MQKDIHDCTLPELLDRAATELRWAGSAANANSPQAKIQLVKECEELATRLEVERKRYAEPDRDTQAMADNVQKVSVAIGRLLDVYPRGPLAVPTFQRAYEGASAAAGRLADKARAGE